jgi:hypothetical protein
MRAINLMAILAALALALSSGCTSRASDTADAGPDGQIQPDAGPDAQVVTAWDFHSDDDGTASPAVVLTAEKAQGGEVWLDVQVRGLTSLHGLAFRLRFDPKQVEVLASEAGQVWQLSSVNTVNKFAVRDDGELWAGIAHMGDHGLVAQSETQVARVKLKLKGSAPIKVGFRDHHNLILDHKGQRVEADWLGGSFKPAAQ